MAKIVTLKDDITQEIAYPQTRASAVYMDNDNTVQEEITELDQELEEEIEEFEQTIRNQIDNYRPIEITGDVTNAPDEEDITTDENDLLKFKNRNNLYGMGYVILRRDKTFAEQVTLANTIYEIRYDFDLRETSELDLDTAIAFDGDVYYTHATALSLAANQKLWVPAGCVVLNSTKDTLLASGDYTPSTAVSVFIAASSSQSVSYQVNGLVTIPSGCVLRFDGGSISGGVIHFNDTLLTGDIKILSEVEGSVSNPYIYGEWFGAKGDESGDVGAVLNRIMPLAKSTSIPIKFGSGKFAIRTHIALNGYVPDLDVSRFLDHKNISIEGNGEETIFVNYSVGDVFNLGYCKNIALRNFAVTCDDSCQEFIESRQVGVNLCSIVDAINITVEGIYAKHGLYYNDRENHYFDGGKGITIQGKLFQNINVKDCYIEDCIYGLDVTTNYAFCNDPKSKIYVNNIYVNKCYRGLLVINGSNRDDSVLDIINGLSIISNITCKNCFQAITTQQATGVNVSCNVNNTMQVDDLVKRLDGVTSWLAGEITDYIISERRCYGIALSASLNSKYDISLNLYEANYGVLFFPSNSDGAKTYINRNNDITVHLNESCSFVPVYGESSITNEGKFVVISDGTSVMPYITTSIVRLFGFTANDTTLEIPTSLLRSVEKNIWFIDGRLYVERINIAEMSLIRTSDPSDIRQTFGVILSAGGNGSLSISKYGASGTEYPVLSFCGSDKAINASMNSLGEFQKAGYNDSSNEQIIGGGHINVRDNNRNIVGRLPVLMFRSKGATADRPDIANSSLSDKDFIGFCYFDKSLTQPIWYAGSGHWVDSTGTEV